MSIPYGKQSISKEDIDKVVEILKSDFITQGPAVETFENNLSSYTGAKHVLSFNSATSALHVACLSAGLSHGDILWTSPISFVASSNCALYCGAKIDFVDIDKNTFNISIDALKAKLKIAELENKLPKIIIPVHLAGLPCQLKELKSLSEDYGFKIIEDASHAIGAEYFGSKIGSCDYSDAVVFSFHPVKIITSGEGGALLTNDHDIFSKSELLRSHGIQKNKDLLFENHGDWYYEQQLLGFNYRMTDIQAALGSSQLQRIEEFIEKRNLVAKQYIRRLSHLPLEFQTVDSELKSSYHLFIIKVLVDEIGISHKQIFSSLRKRGIGVNLHYIPIYRQPYYKNFYNYNSKDFLNSEDYYSSAISIPMYPTLTAREIDFVVNEIQAIFDNEQ